MKITRDIFVFIGFLLVIMACGFADSESLVLSIFFICMAVCFMGGAALLGGNER